MRKKLQKVKLFSVEKQQRSDAWLNDTAPLPAMPARPCTEFTEQVCRCIAQYAAANNAAPSAIRANPCSVLELPRNRWGVFPFFYEGRIIEIVVVADQTVPIGEIICEKGKNDQNRHKDSIYRGNQRSS